MKITSVDVIPIYPRLVPRAAAHNAHFPNWNLRTVFRVKADNGLVGYGDFRCPPPPDTIAAPLIGKSPFDFVGNDLNPGLGAALYDLMGKHLDLPAYKLMGPKVRDRVSVAAWTKPVPPDTLAQEVKRAASEGYTHMKMHASEYYDLFEQNKAVEEVAPPGFLMHYDLNWSRSLLSVAPLIRDLESSPTVGFIEDPLRRNDLDGWRRLRREIRVPLIMHVQPLGGLQEVILGCADGYMAGGQIGSTLRFGAALSAASLPLLLQITGGTLTKALALHVAAVTPAATLHSVNLDDQYEDDITTTRIPVASGTSPVPEAPGLGLEVDEDALHRLSQNKPTPVPRHVAVVTLPEGNGQGGPTITFPSLTSIRVQQHTGREEGTIHGISMRLWDDDGTPEFEKAHSRAHSTGPFFE